LVTNLLKEVLLKLDGVEFVPAACRCVTFYLTELFCTDSHETF
jgi:hypothetical protein